MNRQNKSWTAEEIIIFYNFIIAGKDSIATVAKAMGRTEKALRYKAQGGELLDKNFEPYYPFPTFYDFYWILRQKKQVQPIKSPKGFKRSKLGIIFNRLGR